MTLRLSSTGSYPRIGDSPDLQVLRRTIAQVDRAERTFADLLDAENDMTRRAIAEQARAGLELITDGQIRWADPVSHIAGKLAGVRSGGLLRYFDTNFYFRQPVLIGRPQRKAALVREEFVFARNALGLLPTPEDKAGRLSLKPVMTGPYTLAKLSITEGSAPLSLEARAAAYADAIAEEISALAEAGASVIQVDEPAILLHPEDWRVFSEAISRLATARAAAQEKGRMARLALYVYFRDAASLYERLISLPVDIVGLDFTYDPALVDLIAALGSPKALALGLVDGRNTKLEEPAALARQVEKMLPRIAGELAYLGPSCGLEYLPRDRAFAKLQSLEKIRAAVEGAEVKA